MTKLKMRTFLLVACVARRIWLRRNTVVFGGKFLSPAQIVQSTLSSLEAFHHAQHDPDTGLAPAPRSDCHFWQNLLRGRVKIN
jgi:hypothetical protein